DKSNNALVTCACRCSSQRTALQAPHLEPFFVCDAPTISFAPFRMLALERSNARRHPVSMGFLHYPGAGRHPGIRQHRNMLVVLGHVSFSRAMRLPFLPSP